jgi:hypothetical protein
VAAQGLAVQGLAALKALVERNPVLPRPTGSAKRCCMKRFAIFVLLGPPLAAMILFLVLLPLAGLLEGQRIEISVSPSAYLFCLFPALLLAVFDWVTQMIELPYRPIAAAVAGWVLTFLGLREILALPDLPGWFLAIGLLGAIPAFVCSWVTLTTDKMLSVKA